MSPDEPCQAPEPEAPDRSHEYREVADLREWQSAWEEGHAAWDDRPDLVIPGSLVLLPTPEDHTGYPDYGDAA